MATPAESHVPGSPAAIPAVDCPPTTAAVELNIAMSKGMIPIQWIIFYLVISWAFAKLTRKGFAAMAAESVELTLPSDDL
jgi:hypothetical protein